MIARLVWHDADYFRVIGSSDHGCKDVHVCEVEKGIKKCT